MGNDWYLSADKFHGALVGVAAFAGGFQPREIDLPFFTLGVAQFAQVTPSVNTAIVAVVEEYLQGVAARCGDSVNTHVELPIHNSTFTGTVAADLGAGRVDTQILSGERKLTIRVFEDE